MAAASRLVETSETMLRASDIMAAFTGVSVITSYSIHYTKLYDTSLEAAATQETLE